MTQLNPFRFCLWLAFGFAIVGCQTAAISPTATSVPTSTPSPATPTPEIQVISYELSPGAAAGEWRVVGLVENKGKGSVGPIRLSVSLIDTAGERVAEKSTQILMSNLHPGEAGPFSVTFEAVSSPAEARVVPLAFEPADGQLADGPRAKLIAELEQFFTIGSGEFVLIGNVTNPGRSHISLDSLNFLGLGPNGAELVVAVMLFGPGWLAPGETVPFLALAPENPGTVQWTQYHDGLIAEPPAAVALEIRGDPLLSFTAQGAPFVVGTLANGGRMASSGSVLISLLDENQLVGLWEIGTPRPLQPGEQLAFAAFGSPGIRPRFKPSAAGAVRVETRIEERPADIGRLPVTLSVDVSIFLSEASTIFIRGTLHNPMEFAVDRATVYAEVRTATGELVTAGWSESQSLEPDQLADFRLELPVPAGMDATLTEYDLRAIGLKAQP